MRPLKFAMKQNQSRIRTENPVDNIVQPYVEAFEQKKKSASSNHSIFLNSKEAMVWIKKQFSRKNKNDFLEIIRKRTMEEFNSSIDIHNTVAIHAKPKYHKFQSPIKGTPFNLKLQKKSTSFDQRVHSWQHRKFSLKKQKINNKDGFLTIQAIDAQPHRQKSQTKVRVRKSFHRGLTSERNRTEEVDCLFQETFTRRKKKNERIKHDKGSFHISTLTPWE